MKIGLFVGASATDKIRLDEIIAQGVQAEEDGFDSFWLPHISARGPDALTALCPLSARRRSVSRLERASCRLIRVIQRCWRSRQSPRRLPPEDA